MRSSDASPPRGPGRSDAKPTIFPRRRRRRRSPESAEEERLGEESDGKALLRDVLRREPGIGDRAELRQSSRDLRRLDHAKSHAGALHLMQRVTQALEPLSFERERGDVDGRFLAELEQRKPLVVEMREPPR